ncbi:N-methyl-D-aspartate receptor NMDAR2C subunit [candidate division KSB1 bacterium]|nr:N-methyl-D-aspartate receptor NMDAR2C subunit [candidate division KSB1 bacterium]
MTDFERWRELWKELNCKTNADEVFRVLVTCYSEPHRAYHTLDHIRHSLNEFESVQHLAVRGKEIELAIWFHDAVYKPVAKDNEERSARLAEQFLLEAEVPATIVESVSKLILATKHVNIPHEPDARLLVDIDLSTLGAPEEIFDEYEKNIRFEYKHVPWLFYKRKRAALLTSFLSRPNIYLTEEFRDRCEAQARRNLARSLARLRA